MLQTILQNLASVQSVISALFSLIGAIVSVYISKRSAWKISEAEATAKMERLEKQLNSDMERLEKQLNSDMQRQQEQFNEERKKAEAEATAKMERLEKQLNSDMQRQQEKFKAELEQMKAEWQRQDDVGYQNALAQFPAAFRRHIELPEAVYQRGEVLNLATVLHRSAPQKVKPVLAAFIDAVMEDNFRDSEELGHLIVKLLFSDAQ